MTYEPRTYRQWVKDNDLLSFNVVVKETDLYIRANIDLRREALKSIIKYRSELEKYIEQHPLFISSIEPLDSDGNASEIIRKMLDAGRKTGVGPMASVAGAIAESVGIELHHYSSEIIVENGGDIFLNSAKDRFVGVYAGTSPLTGKIAIKIKPRKSPVGICTSSGTVGHSYSLGKADAVMVISPSTTLADAAATAIANMVREPKNIPEALDFAESISGLEGVLIIKGDRLGLTGNVNIIPR